MSTKLKVVEERGDTTALREELEKFSRSDRTGGALGQLWINRCFQRQGIRNVENSSPSAMFVVSGVKELDTGDRIFRAGPGEILFVPANRRVHLTNTPANTPANTPGPDGQGYLAIALTFEPEVLHRFRGMYGSRLDEWNLSPRWHAKIPESVTTALVHWLNWSRKFSSDSDQIRHRQVELLLLFAREGLAGNLLLDQHPSWKRRVQHLISLDPSRPWRASEVGVYLAASESSLRRYLQQEGVGFRDILEDVRMTTGFGLVMGTSMMISQIAGNCGYQSQSRFTERFKARYGASPTDLRQTQVRETQVRKSDIAVVSV